MMHRRILGAVILASLCLASRAQATGEPPTNAELSRRLLDEVLQPVVEALESDDAAWGIALRPGGTPSAERASLDTAIGNFFVDRGYEVWTPADSTVLPPAALVLDFEIHEASLDYPRHQGGFLGFGAGRTLRRAVLGVEGRLRDNRDGRWLWRGAPRRQFEDWVRDDRLEGLRGDEPEWMNAVRPTDYAGSSSWWERGIVAGLLGSVIIIYFDGAQ